MHRPRLLVSDDLLPERAAAYKALRPWATVHAQRDEVIHSAAAAGIGDRSIQQITGVPGPPLPASSRGRRDIPLPEMPVLRA